MRVLVVVASGGGHQDATVRVPKLVGLTQEEAYTRLAAAQLCPDKMNGVYSPGDDYVNNQDPPAGSRVHRLARVTLGVDPGGPSGVIVSLTVDPRCGL